MHKFTFHLLCLTHLPTNTEYLSCAYTQKNLKLAKMLTSLGHKVYAYCSEGSNIDEYCNSENLIKVTTHTLKDIRDAYGSGDNRFEIGYDWTNTDFRHDFNAKPKLSTLKFYSKCIQEINKTKKDDDFLLCTQGNYHKPIADTVKLFLTCESGVGYRGSVKGWYRAFESSYIQNYTYGYEGQLACINGSFYDRVIPNYFDPDDMEFSEKKDDYYLFIGRMIKRKGILIAAKTCNAIGKKLIIAGQGASVIDGHLIPNTNPDFDLEPGTWEYVGFADLEKRKKLMAHAIATFVPTEYLEIFGGVHIESMLSGTPVITTDFGVYPGTVINGVSGYRCSTLQDFVDAAKAVVNLKPHLIRKYAEKFTMDNVKLEYQRWFQDLFQVYLSSKDPSIKGWHHMV